MTTPKPDKHPKILGTHLERAAYVYVRQSSLHQVEHNLESKRRQYQLAEWAVAAGWQAERVVVVDEDQGKSGASTDGRAGFGRLVAAVGRGEVGIVVSLEVSRLARNSADWHHLVYLCRWTDTLIADESTVYDPASSADRMVLGIRGQVSELELDSAINRMVEARWSKARRGELTTVPPAGYEVDDLGELVLTTDEAVASAIRTVFSKFDELGSARQVFIWWRDQGLKFPVRRLELRSHPIVWTKATYRMVLQTLHHPIYTGAYVFGRSKTVRELEPGGSRKLNVRRIQVKEWPVLIPGHHDAYITSEKFAQNQERIRGNQAMDRDRDQTERGAAREGEALLQGLARCGQCGRRMHVGYGGHRSRASTSSRTRQYRCSVARQAVGGKECQTVGGKRIDDVVVKTFLEATEPAGLIAAANAGEQVAHESEDAERSWQLQIEKAEYEAQRAERQYHAVEPENRVVARELERRWNARLVDLESVRAQAQSKREQRRPLTEAEVELARQLGSDLEALWSSGATTDRDRKRLLRCLIDEVQMRTEAKRYLVRIVWKGGAITDREVARLARGKGTATSEDTVALVGRLAKEFDDAQIARILNRQGRQSGLGNPFTEARVTSLRGHHQIPQCAKKPARDDREGPFTADEAADELKVSMSTIHQWLREGILAGQQATPGAPWRIVLSDEVRRRLSGGDVPTGWVGLTEAAKRLGLSKQRVAYLVKTGKLNAVRAIVGKRRCWKIDVSSATCGEQAELF